MARITVEGIPDGLLARLQIAADGSGRTLSREVVVQLARSVRCSRGTPPGDVTSSGNRCAGRTGDCGVAHRAESRLVGWGGPA